MSVPSDSASFDRSAAERSMPGLLDSLVTDPTSRVLVMHEGRSLLAVDAVELHLVRIDQVEASSVRAFLGRIDGAAVLLALVDAAAATLLAPAERWAELRAIGGDLPTRDAELYVEALALGRWIADAAHCPACGALTQSRQGGWSRHCPACGRDHFPRTDPAVIVAVTDASYARLLLGSNVAWPAGRYSCFAGFIEAGESAESALIREVEEEAGVVLSELEYLGSQGWPYPRSLMLGYIATAASGVARPDGEEISEVRWFTVDEVGDALAGRGDITLPGSASISRRLIETWHTRALARVAEDRDAVSEAAPPRARTIAR